MGAGQKEAQPHLHTKTQAAQNKPSEQRNYDCVFGPSYIDRRRRNRSRQLHLLAWQHAAERSLKDAAK